MPRLKPLHDVWKPAVLLLLLLTAVLFTSCVSHLGNAKSAYALGQQFHRDYQTEKAEAAFKRALIEAQKESDRHPSAQAFLIKGLTELSLELWSDAEASFLQASVFGYEKGEEWAEQLSLLGLGLSLRNLGLEQASLQIFEHLIDKSGFQPVTRLAAQGYTDVLLKTLGTQTEKEREKSLIALENKVERLVGKDFGYGYYHYLLSQVFLFRKEYSRSFEEAVMGRELGLPTQEVLRDNDLNMVFCRGRLRDTLDSGEWEKFDQIYLNWIKKWGWPDPDTPSWKKR